MAKLTQAQSKAYLADGGNYCPFCSALNPEGQDCNFDFQVMNQEMSCPECGEGWTDHYTLTGITPDQEDEEGGDTP